MDFIITNKELIEFIVGIFCVIAGNTNIVVSWKDKHDIRFISAMIVDVMMIIFGMLLMCNMLSITLL